jgi:hypothetical protein
VQLERRVGLLLAALTAVSARAAVAETGWSPQSGFGMSVAAGGGVTNFTQSNVRDVTDIGGAWDFRLAFGTRRVLAVEGSYVGGANPVHSLGVQGNRTMLIRNGIEGALRVNLPLYLREVLLEPYFTTGIGWSGYRITNVTANTSSSVSADEENTFSIPMAVGFALGRKGFIADVRCTARPTYGQTTFPGAGNAALTNWDVGGMLGFEF